MKQQSWLFTLLLIVLLTATASLTMAQETPGLSAEEIAAYPEPNVVQLYARDSVLHDRTYRRVISTLERYDAPNGNLIGTMGEGFNFVTIRQFSADGQWAEVREGKWVRTDALNEDVALSIFAGVLLPEEGLTYPMAWTMVHLRPSTTPGGDADPDNPFYYRYTKVNIYAEYEVDGWKWYQIGVDQWIRQTSVAMILPVERPEEVDTEHWISVDLYEQIAIAYENETPVFATLISSGMSDWPTNEGLFNIYLRYERELMSGGEDMDDFYYIEEVPWTMYFDGEIALHGAYWHDGFGFRRSHGCVNLSVTDAHWIYEWAEVELDFSVSNDLGAAVYVYSSGDYK
jgi:hypothetical protein